MTLRILQVVSDFDGCYTYRVKIPFDALNRYDIKMTTYPFLPTDFTKDQFKNLCDIFCNYDLVIIQRCYLLHIVQRVVEICEFLGIPAIMEQDDDYENLIPSNPAYLAICDDQELFKLFKFHQDSGNMEEVQKLVPALLESRERGIKNYKKLLSIVDYVTTSTEELKRTIYPHNKNVEVFQNNVERVYPWKNHIPTHQFYKQENGGLKIELINQLGLFLSPSYVEEKDKSYPTPRIGYSGTPSHASEDWGTIRNGLNRFIKKNKNNHFTMFIESQYETIGRHENGQPIRGPYFFNTLEDKSQAFSIPASQYEKYIFNLSNFDIALCPVAPTIFNMSKSDIKLVEAAAWGIPGLAPRFVTYTRNFIEEETTLFYSNETEFVSQLDRLVKDHKLRARLGRNSLAYVMENRLEHLHSERRYEFYRSVAKSKRRLRVFMPNKELYEAAKQ